MLSSAGSDVGRPTAVPIAALRSSSSGMASGVTTLTRWPSSSACSCEAAAVTRDCCHVAVAVPLTASRTVLLPKSATRPRRAAEGLDITGDDLEGGDLAVLDLGHPADAHPMAAAIWFWPRVS